MKIAWEKERCKLAEQLQKEKEKNESQVQIIQSLKKKLIEIEKEQADQDDLLAGLPTNKKKKIIDEVEDLYQKNQLLKEQNRILMKNLHMKSQNEETEEMDDEASSQKMPGSVTN